MNDLELRIALDEARAARAALFNARRDTETLRAREMAIALVEELERLVARKSEP